MSAAPGPCGLDGVPVNVTAAAPTVPGFTLWCCYSSRANAQRTKRLYGAASDVILAVPGFAPWVGLYGREA